LGQTRVGEACGILQDMMAKDYRADLGIHDTLISGLCNVGRINKACKLFEIIVQEGLKPGFKTVPVACVLC
jgi:pentatricopeptide repeat protein